MRKSFLHRHLLVRTPILALLVCLAIFSGLSVPEAWGARIESDPNKVYHLRKKHGPWMIHAASFSGETEEQRQNSIDAANQLVAILRAKNIPAYIYQQDEEIEEWKDYNRENQLKRRHYTAQQREIAVLAGNYESLEDKTAQATLKFVKKMTPKVAVNHHGHKEDVPVNMKKSFLAPNPLVPLEEIKKRTRDPLLAQLNSGVRYSLAENKGKYTLVVASFYGQSEVKPANFAKFDEQLASQRKISLDNAAESAVEMASVLRTKYKVEAYVFHERFRSIVTIGSFSSPSDPAAVKLLNDLKAKPKEDPRTRQRVLVGEAIHLMGPDGKTPVKSWTVDPEPEIIAVPKL